MASESAGPFNFDVDVCGELFPPRKEKPIPLRMRKNRADRDLEDALSSALIVGDKQLDRMVRKLESISRELRPEKAGREAQRAVAVKQALVERELRYLALSDDLTCLYNRRGFYAAATQQLKIAHRNEHPAMLLFCDLDGLKQINDTFGHREGDHALVRTADALEEVFRESDVLARLGGDEFAVLATDLTCENLPTIFERLHKSLRKASQDEARYELSLSVGASWFDPHAPVSLGELMESADQAMYEEKRRRAVSSQRQETTIHRLSGRGIADAITIVKRKS
jgi:diguanylate cyclase (GGDEF)-like protein